MKFAKMQVKSYKINPKIMPITYAFQKGKLTSSQIEHSGFSSNLLSHFLCSMLMKFSQNFQKKKMQVKGKPFKGYKINPKIILTIVDRKSDRKYQKRY